MAEILEAEEEPFDSLCIIIFVTWPIALTYVTM